VNQSDGVEAAAERRSLLRSLNPFGRIRLRVAARLHEWASDLARGELNLSWITDDLAAGGSVRPRDYPRLRDAGVTAVIDLRAESRDDADKLSQLGIEFLHLPTPDRYAPTVEKLATGVRWAEDRLRSGAKVFAHCEHGVGRGPLMVACVLVSRGATTPDAIQTLHDRRWQSSPNDRQIERLLAFESYWRMEADGSIMESASHGAGAPASSFS
jgi:hypothetical protein